MMSKSKPSEKKDAVRAMDDILIDQKADPNNVKSIEDSPKIQHNAFKIRTAKGVVLSQSVKNTLKQLHECRFSDCYRAFIAPIAKKREVQEFLNKLMIEAELI